MVELLEEDMVRFYILFDLLAGVDDRRVVATAEFLADRRIGDIHILAEQIHDDLARLDHLLLARLFVYMILLDVVEVRDDLYDLFDRHRFLRLCVVLEDILYLDDVEVSSLHLRLHRDRVGDAFELADVAVDRIRYEFDEFDRQYKALFSELRLEDDKTGFIIRSGNVDDHTRIKPRFYAVLELYVVRVAVRGTDELLIVLFECVEEVEEFLLVLFFAGKELNVVHDDDVILAVLLFELRLLAELDRTHKVDGEFLGGDVVDLLRWVVRLYGIPYRLHEVCLAAAGVAVDKERVVIHAGIFENRLCRSVSELVERSNYERLERILRIEIVFFIDVVVLERQFERRQRLLGMVVRRHLFPFRSFGDEIFERSDVAALVSKAFEDDLMELFRKPVLGESARDDEIDDTLVDFMDIGIPEPGTESGLRYGKLDHSENALPHFFCIHNLPG